MTDERAIENQFQRADINHDGTIDEQEFRQFLGPVIRDERRLSGSLNPADIQQFNSASKYESHGNQTIAYEVGLDVAVAGFVPNPIEYEKYTGGSINPNEQHQYGVGPDVGIGAPNVARKSQQYDPAGAMFDYADVNHDGRIDKTEFGSFMKSV